MTAEEIKAIVVAVDPAAQRYDSARKGPAYTTWRTGMTLGFMADGEHMGGVRFQIDRFTKDPNDPIAAALFDALEHNDRVAFSHTPDFEPDTGYIHHIFDCEGI